MELFMIFIIGLCFGSFLNVCIYRLPKEQSIVKPGSFCPKCNTPIKWYDNIPLLGYIALRGQCRSCKDKISFRYPFVELLTGLLFLILFMKFNLTADFYKYAFFFSLLIAVSVIDIDYHAIPVYFCFIGIVIGLMFSVWETAKFLRFGVTDYAILPIVESFKGVVFGFGFAYLFKFFGDILVSFYLQFRKQESIEGETESLGLGDVDFLGMVGVFLGLKGAVLVFFIAPFIAVIYAVFAITFKKSHLIPYLPYLSLATLVTFFWGNDILKLIF
ncbi:MAG: prepilin peptidase [Candidatus Omnitrophica bacterium]|nr:prepilin peptidase [Candidatus Omnitrophota bacterium]